MQLLASIDSCRARIESQESQKWLAFASPLVDASFRRYRHLRGIASGGKLRQFLARPRAQSQLKTKTDLSTAITRMRREAMAKWTSLYRARDTRSVLLPLPLPPPPLSLRPLPHGIENVHLPTRKLDRIAPTSIRNSHLAPLVRPVLSAEEISARIRTE